jgi:plastocyanin
MTRALPILLAASALAVAGCGSSSSDSSSSSSSKKSSSSSSASAGTATNAIKMQNIQFSPKAASVKVGQKVTWTNEDGTDHNVTATGGASFKSQDFGKGKTYSFTPKKAGVIKYTCTIHPGMDGVLTVK